MNQCPTCGANQSYIVCNQYRKCVVCKKKWSPKKLAFDKQVYDLFLRNISAHKTAKQLACSYQIIYNRYNSFRETLRYESELYYQENYEQFYEYDEYFLKYCSTQNMQDYINLVGFSDGKRVFITILPSLKKYGDVKQSDLKEFIKWHKIKTPHTSTLLKEFWVFLEASLKIYKGVEKEKIYLYLKEMEMKFLLLMK